MKNLHLILLVCLITACTGSKKQSVDIIIQNINILSIEDDTIIENQSIILNADTIYAVVSSDEHKNFQAERTIDGSGKYIMPGLWDNHVHFRGGDSLALENKNLLPLYLRYGITTVRDAGGDITPQLLEWRKAIKQGELIGPDIFTPGPKLDGQDPAWAGSIKVTQKQDVTDALDSLETLGADFVKTYDGSLSPEMYYEIIKQAELRDKKVTGHMPMNASIDSAIVLGLDGSEHIYYVLKGCSPKSDSLTVQGLGYGMIPTVINTYDDSVAHALFTKMKHDQVYITPTLYIGKILSELADTDHSNDSLLSFIGNGIENTYQGRIESAKRAKENGSTFRQQVNKKAIEMIRPMHDAGVKLLAGSDCGPYNSYVYPGEALHGELRMLVKAGLSPGEAIQTSTVNGSKFFEVEKSYMLSQGCKADLLLLNKNPLDDIANLTAIDGVIKSGKFFSAQDLDSTINKIK